MRRPVAAALAAAIAALAASCASVLGIDDQATSAAEDLCLCNAPDQLGFLGTKEACKLRIDDRLRSAAEADREAWLDAYASPACRQNGCTSKVEGCFYRAPLCTETTFGCSRDEECCSYPHGGDCHDGVCR